jgi:hypothetical protein
MSNKNNKKRVRDLLISIPISLLYVFFINKIIQLLTSESEFEEKIKKKISISFVAIIVGYVLAIKIFSHGTMKNRIIKYSLIIGTTLILINTIIYNWPELKNDTKTFVVGALLLLFFIYSYRI